MDINITIADKEPEMCYWSYPIEELGYIVEQLKDGTREKTDNKFVYWNKRLYELEYDWI